MNLHNVAKMYDTCPVYDAYSGVLLFKAQASTFLESSLEGSTASRRVISVAPEVVIPAHSCILALGDLMIVGGGNPDEWGGSIIRKAHWVKLVTDNFKLLTPGQAVLAAAGSDVFGQRKFIREALNSPTEAEIDNYWEIFVSNSVMPAVGTFFKGPTTYYRVRATYEDVDGFRTCHCDELEEGRVTVTITTTGVYNPVSDSYGTSTINTHGIPLDYIKSYTKRTQSSAKGEQGDIALVVAASALTPVHGQHLTIAGAGASAGNWQIINHIQEQDSWNLHLRRR